MYQSHINISLDYYLKHVNMIFGKYIHTETAKISRSATLKFDPLKKLSAILNVLKTNN